MYGDSGKNDTVLEIEIWSAPPILKLLTILGGLALCCLSLVSEYFIFDEHHKEHKTYILFQEDHDLEKSRHALLHLYNFLWNAFLICCELPAPTLNEHIYSRLGFMGHGVGKAAWCFYIATMNVTIDIRQYSEGLQVVYYILCVYYLFLAVAFLQQYLFPNCIDKVVKK